MTDLTVRALDTTTWPDFDALVADNNGVWGGCWCMGFHAKGSRREDEDNRMAKERLITQGETHAALVYRGDSCAGWCQFGPTAELPRIKSKREYEVQLGDLPDWRITCFFVGKGHRHLGVAAAALDGALNEIAALGGGVVESYPEEVVDRKVSSSFLHNGTLAMFEAAGFVRDRKIAKHRWVVRRLVS